MSRRTEDHQPAPGAALADGLASTRRLPPRDDEDRCSSCSTPLPGARPGEECYDCQLRTVGLRPGLYTSKQMAAYLQVPESQWRKLCHSGQVDAAEVQLGDEWGTRRWDVGKVLALLSKRRAG